MNAEVDHRHAIGAYLLGALGPAETGQLEAHIRGCEPCRSELLELGGAVADLAVLAPAGPHAVPGLPGPPGPIVDARGRNKAVTRTSRVPLNGSGRRMVMAAAVAAALVAAGAGGFALGGAGSGEPTRIAGPSAAPGLGSGATSNATPTTRPPGARTVQGSSKLAVTGYADLVPTSWGTSIEITMTGLQQSIGPGVECELMVVAASGDRGTVGSWVVPPKSPTPAGERFKVPTAVPIRELAKVVVVTSDGTEVLVLTVVGTGRR